MGTSCCGFGYAPKSFSMSAATQPASPGDEAAGWGGTGRSRIAGGVVAYSFSKRCITMTTSSTTHCGRGDRAMTLALAHTGDQEQRRDRNRYYALLEDELERVELSEPEACLLVDALNGTAMDATSYRSLSLCVSDACRVEGLDAKWDVDRRELEAKLQSVTPGQAMAVVDAAERFWKRVSESSESDLSTPELLEEVGLL